MSATARLFRRFLDRTDEINWEEVYTDQLPRVYNYFRYRFGDDMLAEDLTATTFEKVWRYRLRYRKDLGAFSTWLFTVAKNVARDYLRKKFPAVYLEELPAQREAESPEDIVNRIGELNRLNYLLKQLPQRERELVALKYGAGLTNREIARQTGLSETNVGTILHRVVGRLREEWERKNE